MLSRGPECIYWMSRNVERAENVARFIDVNDRFGRDLPPGMPPRWGPLLLTIADDPQLFVQRYGEPTQENVIRFLTFDSENSRSILACWRAAHENARSARNAISSAMWEELNEFCLFVEGEAKQGKRDSTYNFLRQVKRASHLLEGIANATLTQGEAWHFGRLGRLLERAEMTTRMVHVKYFMAQAFSEDEAGCVGPLHWKAVLQSAGAFEMYGRQHGTVKLDLAADFLMRDLQFPRSVRSCIRRANESLHAISGTPTRTFQNPAEQRLGRLVALLDYADMQEIGMWDLHEFLVVLRAKLEELGDSISKLCSREAPV